MTYLAYLAFLTCCISQWIILNTIVTPKLSSQTGVGTIYQTLATCPNNPLQYAYLDSEFKSYYYYSSHKPHYMFKFIVDIFYMGTFTNEFGALSQDGQDIYNITYNSLENMTSYGNLCGLSIMLNSITIVQSVSHSKYLPSIYFTTNLAKLKVDSAMMFRNLQYQALPCHYSCQTCSGPAYNQCKSCYYSDSEIYDEQDESYTYETNNGVCDKLCYDDEYFFVIEYFYCTKYCALTYFTDPIAKQCIPSTNQEIKQIRYDWYTTLPTYWTFLKDPIYSTSSTMPTGIRCSQYDPYNYIYLRYNEGISTIYNLELSHYQLRVELTILIYGVWDLDSSIRLYIDQIEVSQLKYGLDNMFYLNQGIVTYQYKSNCYSNINIRLPYYQLTGQLALAMTIKGNLLPQSAQVWRLYSISTYGAKCDEQCLTCRSIKYCNVCKPGSYLLKGKCLPSCPKYSTSGLGVCNSFDEETQYSKFLFKVYHDNNEIDDEVDDYFELVSQTGLNFVKGVRFSYLSDCRIFGGPLTWFNAKFSKTYQINNPHYALRVRMEPIIGDLEDSISEFNYAINNQPNVKLNRLSSGSLKQNIAGDSKDEYIFTINQLFTHNTNTLTVTVECKMKSSLQINQGFCAIRNYFIIILGCPTFCLACTGPNAADCTQWSTVPNQTPNTPTCELGYYIVDQTCNSCTVIDYCVFCNNQLECTQCLLGFNLQFGRCLCQDNYELAPNQLECQLKPICHPLCLQCSGPTEHDCFSCNDNQIRYFSQGLCKCKLNYYDSGSLICSLCTPGCLQCNGPNQTDCLLWQCHTTCLACSGPAQSECTQCNIQMHRKLKLTACSCVDGYYSDGTQQLCSQCQLQLTDQFETCYNNCGDGIVQWNEQCDDANEYHFDGCFNCLFECQAQCSNCVYGRCLNCMSGWILVQSTGICVELCGDGILTGNEICDDGNKDRFDGCFNCQFECIQECNVCVQGLCLNCNSGYNLINNQCQPICGDGIVVYAMEQCDDGIDIHCHNCLYECEYNCQACVQGLCYNCNNGWYLTGLNTCETQCGDGIQAGEEECDDGIISEFLCFGCKKYCDTHCNDCSYGMCNIFENGWYQGVGYQLSESFCGDSIIVGMEECDDGNNVFEDGCYNCKLQCQEQCDNCQFGKCIRCIQGWVLEYDNKCYSLCGDGIIVGNEQCDDSNLIPYDGCYECRFQCQTECINCTKGFCLECVSTHILIEQTFQCVIEAICGHGEYLDKLINECFTKCGDMIVALNEQCEDGNEVAYDGCYDCKYQCIKNCKDCNQGVCENCLVGYGLQNGQCEIVCGDGILMMDEECDDGNTIGRDGCTGCLIDKDYKCIQLEVNQPSVCYKCQKNCMECDLINKEVICTKCSSGYFNVNNSCKQCSEKCEECQNTPNQCTKCLMPNCIVCEKTPGYYTNLLTLTCDTKCGDGILTPDEQCDDGNQNNKDGCDENCKKEKKFACDDSGCNSIPLPNVKLDYINSTSTNDLKLEMEDFNIDCNLSTVYIEQFENTEYSVNITNTVSGENGCDIKFDFFKTIDEFNLIHIQFPIQIENNRLLQETRDIIIVPRKILYTSESQKEQAVAVGQAQTTFSSALTIIGPIAILLGGFQFFFALLDILAWLNNFYFLNVNYPENVKTFFQQLEWGDILMLPNTNQFNNPGDTYYFEAPRRFAEKNLNQIFYNNNIGMMQMIFLALLTYSVQKWTIMQTMGVPTIYKYQAGIGMTIQQPVTCPNNGLQFGYLDNEYTFYYYSIYSKPHYRIKYLVDIQYMGQFANEFGALRFNELDIYNTTYDYLQNMTAYGNLCGLSTFLNQITIVYNDTHSIQMAPMNITTNLGKLKVDSAVLIRNIQYQILPCHYSCKTCSGPTFSECNSCYYSDTIVFDPQLGASIYKPTNGICTKLCQSQEYQFDINSFQCVNICQISLLSDDVNKFCRADTQRITLLQSYYYVTIVQQWTFLPDPIYSTYSTIPTGIRCFSYDPFNYIYLRYDEGVSLIQQLEPSYYQIRVEINLKIYGVWDQTSSIRVYFDQIEVSLLNSGLNNVFQVSNGVIYNQFKSSCYTQLTLRPLYYALTGQSTITLIIKGNLDPKSAQVWEISNIVIFTVECAKLCEVCRNISYCNVCKPGYNLFKGTCVPICPKYSLLNIGVCNSFDEETQYSKFLFKVYHDNNEIDDEVDDYFELVSQTGLNFVKGVRFSYLNDCRIFGGPLTWFNAKFSKTYQINNPHYALRVMMEPIIGDLEDSISEFNYEINNQPNIKLNRLSFGSLKQNIAGDSKDEYIFTINQLFTHNTNTLTVTVECIMESSLQINQGFCAIRNYFIIILGCPTFCLACTGPNAADCTQWSTVPNQIPNTPTCELGYYLLDQTCTLNTVVPYCQTYNNVNECTACLLGFNLSIGRCLCQDNYEIAPNQLECILKPICHSICLQCSGPTELNCYSCNDTQYRFLSKGLCKCKLNYYDSGTLICSQCTPGCQQCTGPNQSDCEIWTCHFSCQTCNSPSECTSCNIQMYRQLKHVVCPCIDGYYSDGTQQLCQQCELQLTDEFETCYNNCGDGVVQWNEQCDDANEYHFDGCFNCLFECQVQCSNCVNGKCLNCVSEWILNTLTGACVELCGDGILNEVCDDGNNARFDGCFNCHFECIQECNDCVEGLCLSCNYGYNLANNQCQPICGDGIVVFGMEQCDDASDNHCYNCHYECEASCQACAKGLCQNCVEGQYLTSLNTCETQCGDGQLAGEEECDDGIISDFVCFGCKKQCVDHCNDCKLGICLKCQVGYYMNDNQQCYNICGDGIVVENEQCDDKNQLPYDGCYECSYQCQQECTNCNHGICMECVSSHILMETNKQCVIKTICGHGEYFNQQNNQCFAKCGDMIIAMNEQCEDGNEVAYDGCYDCKYQCIKNCKDCNQGVCENCLVGYGLQNGQCEIVCGDGILMMDEECDDGNTIGRDGCTGCLIDKDYKCIQLEVNKPSVCYKCQKNCMECDLINKEVICTKCSSGYFNVNNSCKQCSEKCEECQNTPNQCTKCLMPNCIVCEKTPGYYTNLLTLACDTKCGDGILTPNEQCDDGNQNNKDGCDENCKKEKKFACDDSGCNSIPLPNVKLDYINSTSTNDLKLEMEDFNIDCNLSTVYIEQFENTEYSVNITNTVSGENGCDIKFDFFKTIDEFNLIHIQFPIQIENNRLLQETRDIIIVPRKILYTSESQKEQAVAVGQAQTTFSSALTIIGPIAILLGGFQFFFALLDILAWLNNFYFLNVNYPENVKIFFQQLEWGDILMLPNTNQFNNPGDTYYFEAPRRFAEKSIDPLFFNK